jgi:hypothetical protein
MGKGSKRKKKGQEQKKNVLASNPTICVERDIPFCGGNCTISTPSIPAMAKEFFTNASRFEELDIPNAGHGTNLVNVTESSQRVQKC